MKRLLVPIGAFAMGSCSLMGSPCVDLIQPIQYKAIVKNQTFYATILVAKQPSDQHSIFMYDTLEEVGIGEIPYDGDPMGWNFDVNRSHGKLDIPKLGVFFPNFSNHDYKPLNVKDWPSDNCSTLSDQKDEYSVRCQNAAQDSYFIYDSTKGVSEFQFRDRTYKLTSCYGIFSAQFFAEF